MRAARSSALCPSSGPSRAPESSHRFLLTSKPLESRVTAGSSPGLASDGSFLAGTQRSRLGTLQRPAPLGRWALGLSSFSSAPSTSKSRSEYSLLDSEGLELHRRTRLHLGWRLLPCFFLRYLFNTKERARERELRHRARDLREAVCLCACVLPQHQHRPFFLKHLRKYR